MGDSAICLLPIVPLAPAPSTRALQLRAAAEPLAGFKTRFRDRRADSSSRLVQRTAGRHLWRRSVPVANGRGRSVQRFPEFATLARPVAMLGLWSSSGHDLQDSERLT